MPRNYTVEPAISFFERVSTMVATSTSTTNKQEVDSAVFFWAGRASERGLFTLRAAGTRDDRLYAQKRRGRYVVRST